MAVQVADKAQVARGGACTLLPDARAVPMGHRHQGYGIRLVAPWLIILLTPWVHFRYCVYLYIMPTNFRWMGKQESPQQLVISILGASIILTYLHGEVVALSPCFLCNCDNPASSIKYSTDTG